MRVAVQARLRCGMSEWMTVLQALETGAPQLRVDRLDILASAAAPEAGNGLDVSFELSGYLRPGTTVPTTEVTNAQ
ncbi:General secretion pathway protein M [compost metagenome]